MKLKTLKDIFEKKYDGVEDEFCLAELEDELKAEAVKWVKDFAPDGIELFTPSELEYSVNWIIKFFNLSEEDLE